MVVILKSAAAQRRLPAWESRGPELLLISKPFPRLLIALIALVTLTAFAGSSGIAQTPGTTNSRVSEGNQLNMLVLGDSIMWGQGLRKEDKSWWRVKSWLQDKTGREVKEKIEAHSGALIETTPGLKPLFTSHDGEVNLITPTINDQINDARNYYGDTSQVDLVLVDGCINDVDVRNLLDASTSLTALNQRIKEKCGRGMQPLLQRITTEFPNAHVVVTSYYRIISSKSANNSFTRLLVKKLASQTPEARQMSDREMRDKLIAISEQWYQTSTQSLKEAVAAANSELEKDSSKQRVLFAEIEFSPEHAFSAPDTLLWNFKFGSTNLYGLRKAIVVLTFGTAAYKPDDPVRESRTKSCKETYREPRKGNVESKAVKERRELSELACRYASLGHPNKMGALIYTEAIKGQLQWLISDFGWLRTPSRSQVKAN